MQSTRNSTLRKPTLSMANYEAIRSYEAARTYLDGIMGDNKTLPIEVQEKQKETLTAKISTLCERYYSLQDEV